jgi:signal transduction histidine kinase
MAVTTASQIGPEQMADIALRRDESEWHDVVQTLLTTLKSATGVVQAVLADSSREVLVDALSSELTEGLVMPLDSLARSSIDRALAGEIRVTPLYRREGRVLRAGLAPVVAADGHVAGLVAVEVEPAYVSALTGLGRTLLVVALVSALAIGLLAVWIIRAARSGARLERRLSRAENLAAMGRLTATLAHEIKNPLAIIRGSAERLKKLEPEAQRMADFVIEESDRLSKTVARYLQFAKGGDELADEGDARLALHATLDLLEGELGARRVVLERRGAADEPVPVALDNESLKQVYLNLILNALEAMPDGGRLTIEEGDATGRFTVSIHDEGRGMPRDVVERLGNPFFTTKAQGSGLGLFLTRRLVQASGGDLVIESEIGRGTTCTVRLPRRRG